MKLGQRRRKFQRSEDESKLSSRDKTAKNEVTFKNENSVARQHSQENTGFT
jgi:hypothetical protein